MYIVGKLVNKPQFIDFPIILYSINNLYNSIYYIMDLKIYKNKFSYRRDNKESFWQEIYIIEI